MRASARKDGGLSESGGMKGGEGVGKETKPKGCPAKMVRVVLVAISQVS